MRLPLFDGLRPGGRYASWAPATPRYVVVDVDGTLIVRGTTATPVVAEAVGAAHAAGLRVGFATGRLPTGLNDLHGQLRPEGPHIVHNGAMVRWEGRTMASWPLQAEAARALWALCVDADLYLEFFIEETFWISDDREAIRPHYQEVTGDPAGFIADLDLAQTEVIKATIVAFDPDELARILPAVASLGLTAGGAISPVTPDMTFVNVTDPHADKGQAVAYAAGQVGCDLSEVVAIGDAANDLTMLAVAGTAVAMGQAPEDVRAMAHVIVPEAEADGVAHALHAAADWRRAAER